MNCYRLPTFKAFTKIISLKHSRYSMLCRQLNQICWRHCIHPAWIKQHLGFIWTICSTPGSHIGSLTKIFSVIQNLSKLCLFLRSLFTSVQRQVLINVHRYFLSVCCCFVPQENWLFEVFTSWPNEHRCFCVPRFYASHFSQHDIWCWVGS